MLDIVRANNEHTVDMKAINEKCLPENYSIYFWEKYVSYDTSFVLKDNNLIVGYCLCDDNGTICSFAILPEYRGMGYGKRLMTDVLNNLTPNNKSVTLQVRVGNYRAINLYKSLGFSVKDTISKYYEDGENAYVMVKQN